MELVGWYVTFRTYGLEDVSVKIFLGNMMVNLSFLTFLTEHVIKNSMSAPFILRTSRTAIIYIIYMDLKFQVYRKL